MPVRAFMSGIESKQHWKQCLSAGVRHVLTSYWQFFRSDKGVVARRKTAHPEMRFMIDSGAHTFQADWTKFKDWKEQDFENYVKEYAAWLKENRKHIFAAVELDIDYCLNMVLGGSEKSTVGSAIVERWQREYFRPLELLGLDITYVWHENRGMEGWEQMCAENSYVGLPGEFSKKDDFNKYMTVARRYTTKVHGFAATKHNDYRDIAWYSIDSITWKTGEMYGTLIDWDAAAQTLTFVEKADRPAYRAKMEAAGFDADGVVADRNYKEVTRYSLWSMRQMEAFYAEKYKERTYYYQLRLPRPEAIARKSDKWLLRTWKLFRPDTLFREHSTDRPGTVRMALSSLACVQYADFQKLQANQNWLAFLATYFPKLARPLVADPRVFQRELSYYISPPNTQALARVDPSSVTPNANAPKVRETDLSNLNLVPDWERHPLVQQLVEN